jgi:hypothetical protein
MIKKMAKMKRKKQNPPKLQEVTPKTNLKESRIRKAMT